MFSKRKKLEVPTNNLDQAIQTVVQSWMDCMAGYGQEPKIITAFAGDKVLGHAVSILKESKWSDEEIHKSLQSWIDTWNTKKQEGKMLDFLKPKPPSMKDSPNYDEIMECNKRIAMEISEAIYKHEAYFNQLPGNVGPLPHMVEVLCLALRCWVAMVFMDVGEADAQQFADVIKQLVSGGLDQQIRDCQDCNA